MTVTFILLLAGGGFADHLPDRLSARGRAEKVLAGIRLERDKMSDVVRLYGEPHCVIANEYAPEQGIVDSYKYYWDIGKVRLHLFVLRDEAIVGGEQIQMIEVTGRFAAGMLGRTGSGLSLGDDFTKIRRLYGKRYEVRNIPEYEIHDVMLQWKRSGYTLSADLDEEDRIRGLTLIAPD